MENDVNVSSFDDTPKLDDDALAEKLAPLGKRRAFFQALAIIFMVPIIFLYLYLNIYYDTPHGGLRSEATPEMGLGTAISIMLISCVISGFCGVQARKFNKKKKKLIGENVLHGMLAENFELIEYDPDKSIEKGLLQDARIGYWNSSAGSDFFRAKYGAVYFTFSDVRLSEGRGKAAQGNQGVIYRGQWLILNIDKEIPSWLVVSDVLQRDRQDGQAHRPKVQINNEDFDKKFTVRTRDPDTAFNILTPHFMELIMSARAVAGCGMHICFVDKHLHIGINTGKNSFAPCKKAPNIPELREKVQQEIGLVKAILDEFLLNEWLFEPENQSVATKENYMKEGVANMNHNELIEAAVKCGASAAAVVDVDKITFDREFRDACEKNFCGKYGKNWTCPPDCGDIDEMMAKAKSYKHVLVFQSIGLLEDSYDIEGMQEAAKNHNKLMAAVARDVVPLLENPLRLGAGGCHVCERCGKMDDIPCRFPEKATVSLEAYGISVTDLASLSGLKYINGVNTVTFFGGILF